MEDQTILWKNSNMNILSLCFLQKGHGHLLKYRKRTGTQVLTLSGYHS